MQILLDVALSGTDDFVYDPITSISRGSFTLCCWFFVIFYASASGLFRPCGDMGFALNSLEVIASKREIHASLRRGDGGLKGRDLSFFYSGACSLTLSSSAAYSRAPFSLENSHKSYLSVGPPI